MPERSVEADSLLEGEQKTAVDPPVSHPPEEPAPPYEYRQTYVSPQTQHYDIKGKAAVGVAAQDVPRPGFIVRQTQPQPSDFLAFSIFVTVCCCVPFGIVGIVKAMEVRTLYIAGDFVGAQRSSMSAKRWSVAGLVVGILIQIAIYTYLVIYYVFIFPSIIKNQDEP